MRGRATPIGHATNPIKVWEQGDTREDLFKNILNRELWNFYTASRLFCAILGIPADGVPQQHDTQVQRQFGGPIVQFTVEFDDGSPTEEIEINVGWDAIINAGIPTLYEV